MRSFLFVANSYEGLYKLLEQFKVHPDFPKGKATNTHIQLILLTQKMIPHSSGIVCWQVSPFGGDLEGAELLQ